jgi:hypothetical protein
MFRAVDRDRVTIVTATIDPRFHLADHLNVRFLVTATASAKRPHLSMASPMPHTVLSR